MDDRREEWQVPPLSCRTLSLQVSAATIGPQSEWSEVGSDREVKGHDALAFMTVTFRG
jgi:hypothetical protein